MRQRGRNGANPGIIPPLGRGSDNKNRAYGKDALSGDSGRAGAGTTAAVGAIGAAVAAAGDVGAEAAAAGPRLGLPAGGGEDFLTLGLKLCPPRVFTIAGLEKERMGGRKVSEMKWNGNERRERGGGGGGGGLNR